jgi:predicted O-methyltransferase YrrM
MAAAEIARKLCVKVGRVVRRQVPARWHSSTPEPVLAQALGRWASASSDIHDHLPTIFAEAVAARPRLMVELGTRGGVSTRALLAAAEICDAHVLSIDIADCSRLDLPERFHARWTFVCADDMDFAGQPFSAFCAERGLPPFADVVFVDTSHAYAHTRAEIEKWMPRLSPRGIMLFHDTNMANWFRRMNGKVERGSDNGRGVIRAIEEFLGRRYDEATYFTDVAAGYLVSHVPWSSGLTILRKLGTDEARHGAVRRVG